MKEILKHLDENWIYYNDVEKGNYELYETPTKIIVAVNKTPHFNIVGFQPRNFGCFIIYHKIDDKIVQVIENNSDVYKFVGNYLVVFNREKNCLETLDLEQMIYGDNSDFKIDINACKR